MTTLRTLLALGCALALTAAAGCLPEFPADPPAPPPNPEMGTGDDGGPEPEPEPEPEPDEGPGPDMAEPEPDLGPQPETCDGTDEDLDRRIDEDFALNQPCTTDDGRCGLTGCAADGSGTTCGALPDAPAQGDERCNGVDDDCDGDTDEGFSVAVECMVGTGACETFGLQICAPDGMGTVCDATAGEAIEESCNDVDDDCDGETDEEGVCDE
ncbi:MAG: MopE-related protein [bacterium]